MSALIRAVPRVARVSLATRWQLRCYASYPAHSVIDMPALSPTMTQGNLSQWAKKEGDKLSPGDVIAEIETDKATMDFEYQDDAYLAKILIPAGTKDIPVGKPIAVTVEDAADVDAFKDFKVEEAAPKEEPKKQDEPKKQEEPKKEEDEKKSATPSRPAAKTAAPPQDRIIASPLAKNIALDKGVCLKNLKGTGRHGRITAADVEKFLTNSPAAAGSVTGAGAPTAATYEDTPISNMRSIIGKRLLESTQSIPSYIVSSDVSVSKLLKLRKSLNDTAKDQYKLSINDILIKAITVAAKRVPAANAYWLEDQGIIRTFNNVDVSVAVATPSGLLTPIIKNVESKGLVAISKEVKEKVSRAKINKLKPEEFQGGTICISNMGMNSAVSMFTSIINPPQSTILAVSTVRRVAVEDAGAENGIAFDDQMTITGTFDHRTIDGAKGGEFMKALKEVVENPLELLL
ncbi:probable Dihydrolipoyllysine-residue acetyltransferase component of pyruvate dehydrogenase complex, mitochondrial [Zygosaccharomyces bailii ISA1307]|nr:probable Dihydrolipoyllysine-residue acetyltransferase component of pyruvate dehydrogenase complex, mitochondrial [Zygosaccharomyces bailii ISA1307]